MSSDFRFKKRTTEPGWAEFTIELCWPDLPDHDYKGARAELAIAKMWLVGAASIAARCGMVHMKHELQSMYAELDELNKDMSDA